MLHDMALDELLDVCRCLSNKGLSPATGGNFSLRLDEKQMIISASGKDKSQLTKSDFVTCDLEANLIAGQGRPSAETYLHGMIYRLSPETGCVLHTHSVAVTVLSLLCLDEAMIFQGYEMQKTITGMQSHAEPLAIPIFDNDQDIPRLAHNVQKKWQAVAPAHGLIVRGHGLYSWGNTVFEAKRHMEGLEFLLQCELVKKQLVRS